MKGSLIKTAMLLMKVKRKYYCSLRKNMRDERIVPCPTCRSNNVRGNSYPVLGVKSWECNNVFAVIKANTIEAKDTLLYL